MTQTDEARAPFHILTPFGYAPGNYMCRCRHCARHFEGDKRATACLACANALAKRQIEKHHDTPTLGATVRWLTERHANCLRIAKQKAGADRDGWLDDARHFAAAIAFLSPSPRTYEREEWSIDNDMWAPTHWMPLPEPPPHSIGG